MYHHLQRTHGPSPGDGYSAPPGHLDQPHVPRTAQKSPMLTTLCESDQPLEKRRVPWGLCRTRTLQGGIQGSQAHGSPSRRGRGPHGLATMKEHGSGASGRWSGAPPGLRLQGLLRPQKASGCTGPAGMAPGPCCYA